MKIAVAIDLSIESGFAVRWALDFRDLLRQRGEPVELIALSVAPSTWYSMNRADKTTSEPGFHHRYIHDIREFLESIDPDVDDVQIEIDEGRPSTLLADFCEILDIDYMVIGTPEPTPMSRWLWGSTAEQLAEKIHSTLVVVHPDHHRIHEHSAMVVGMDFRQGSERALLSGAYLAHLSGAHIHLFHALQDPPSATLNTGLVNYLSPTDIAHLSANARDSLEGIMDDVQKRYPDLRYSTVVESGSPARILCDYSKKIAADALVLGKVRRSATADWLLGGSARHLLKKMPTTIILVPEHA